MLQDVRFASRLLRRSPGFTAAAVATLAIGIGATTAIFTLVDAVLLRPVQIPMADRVVVLQAQTSYGLSTSFLYGDVAALTGATAGKAHLTIEYSDQVLVEGPAGLSKRTTAFVGADYFEVLQRPPVRGRPFTGADDQAGAEPVVIVGYGFWRSALSGDEHVVGSRLRLAGVPFTVVGVAAPGVRGTELRAPAEIFAPAHAILRTTTVGAGAGNYYFQDGSPGWSPGATWRIVGRLAPGVSRDTLAALLSAQHIEPVPVQQAAVSARARGDVSRFTTVLFVAVLLVLTIGCANLAGLTMARTEARRRDIAIRLAVGISRSRLVMQLAIECLIVACVGAVGGVVLGRWLLTGLTSFELPGFIPVAAIESPLDARLLLFSTVLAVASALAFGVAPARMAAKTDVLTALKRERGIAGRARVRHALIFGQVGITVVLLFGAGLFIRSLQVALGVDVGADTRSVVVAEPDLRSARYDAARQAGYYDAAAARLSSLPGVRAVSWGTGPFVFAGNSTPVVVIDGQSIRLPKNVAVFQGGPDYFRTLGIALIRGRDFTPADGLAAPPVVVVNAAFARRFWADGDPIGHRVKVQPWIGDALVIGVVEDGKYSSLTEDGRLAVFAPWKQTARTAFSGAVIVRAENAERVLPSVRTELAALDRAVFVGRVNRLSDRVAQLMTLQRFGSWLLGSFAVVGLLLGIVGVHGLLSYLIAQRTHEIGVRIALGAGRRDVARLVAGGVTVAIVGGAVAGVAASWWLSRLVERLLFGVQGHDPVASIGAVVLLLVAAALGVVIPVRHALRVDPMIALRTE
jgi:predicted permease